MNIHFYIEVLVYYKPALQNISRIIEVNFYFYKLLNHDYLIFLLITVFEYIPNPKKVIKKKNFKRLLLLIYEYIIIYIYKNNHVMDT